MTALEKLDIALSSVGIPTENTFFTGKAKEYVVYVLTDETPSVYGDDVDLLEVASFYVNIYTPANPRSIVKKVQRALRAAGFSIENTIYQRESDTKLYHATISTCIEQFTNVEE